MYLKGGERCKDMNDHSSYVHDLSSCEIKGAYQLLVGRHKKGLDKRSFTFVAKMFLQFSCIAYERKTKDGLLSWHIFVYPFKVSQASFSSIN